MPAKFSKKETVSEVSVNAVNEIALNSFKQSVGEVSDSADAFDFSEQVVDDYSKINFVDLIDQPAWKTILLDLVASTKMNPWDIDVSALSDSYLQKISLLESKNLRVPANAILACAILLRTKSKHLRLSPVIDEEDLAEMNKQKALLNEEVPDLLSMRSMREGRISLDELVSSIEDIMQRTTPSKKYLPIEQQPVFVLPAEEFSIEEKMDELLAIIKNKTDSQGIVLFSSVAEGQNEPHKIVELFIPLLFLINKNVLNAWQDEFFGEIFIKLE
jgi:segregation and condensation protein A